MANKKLTIICDKGKGMSSCNGAAFVKLLAQYNDSRGRVCATSIGIQSTGNTSQDRAMCIDKALKLFDTLVELLGADSTGTDAGGGQQEKTWVKN